jgi:glycosyltransferase involved in cell wall biosynthesis
MTQPLVSVVMAVHNGCPFLGESIESILNQSFDDFEFLVIDDGSTDETSQILHKYAIADHRVRIYTQQNLGHAPSLNRGWRLARGELIARMDADDLAKPERIKRQVEFLKFHPEVVVLGTSFEFINRDGKRRLPMSLPSQDFDIKKTLPYGNCLAHPTIMMRKSTLIEMGGYRSTFLYAEDYDLWLRIAERHALANLDDPLLGYRIHPGQISLRHIRQQAVSALAVRLAAQSPKDLGRDPFDQAKSVTEESLYKLGVTPESLTLAIDQSVGAMSDVALQLGEMEIWNRLQSRAPAGVGPWRSTKMTWVVDGCVAGYGASSVAASRALKGFQETRMSGPQVSVIIPCYNQGRFLGEAVDSILAQTHGAWECLIINDGSTDNTAEIAVSYARRDERIRCLHQHKRGLGGARNRGLAESRGVYVQFLDADDILLPEKIERQLQILQGQKEPSLAYCDFYVTDGADLSELFTNELCEPRLIMERALFDIASRWETELSIPIHCFLINLRLLREGQVNFDEGLRSHEDWDLWMRIFRSDPVIKHAPEKLAVYRRHNDAMCTNRDIMWQGYSKAIDNQLRLFEGHRQMQKILKLKKTEIRQLYFGKGGSNASANFAAQARRLYKHRVPWPLQKLVGRFINVE